MSWDDLFEDNYDWPVWRQSEARRGKDGQWRDAQGESSNCTVPRYQREPRDGIHAT